MGKSRKNKNEIYSLLKILQIYTESRLAHSLFGFVDSRDIVSEAPKKKRNYYGTLTDGALTIQDRSL